MGDNKRICKMADTMLPAIRTLWMECFGDDEAYVDFYFREYREGRTTWVLKEERIAGMVSEMTCELVRKGASYPLRYQYAGGVAPEFRGRGLFPELMRQRREEAAAHDEAVIFEPGPGLFEYYRRMGYRDLFPVKEYSFETEAGRTLSLMETSGLRRAEPEDYLRVRDSFFTGDGYVKWGLPHIRYAIAECELAGGGAYYTGGTTGGDGGLWSARLPHIALVGGIMDGELQVKEAMIPDESLKEELSELAAVFSCSRVSVRLPEWSSLPGILREFGVGYGPHTEGMERPYLNLTLD